MDYITSNRLFMAQMYIENVLGRECYGITSYKDAKIITRVEHVLAINVNRKDPPVLKIVGVRSKFLDEIINVCTARGWKIEEVHL